MILFVGLAAFACFLIGMPGTIAAYRDAGDMVGSAWTLGIAHPPGYPLYVLLAKAVAELIPFANIAYRINLFSALCGGAAAGLLFYVSYYITPSPPVGWEKVGLRGAVPSPQPSPTGGGGVFGCIVYLAIFLWVLSPAALALCRVSEMYALAALLAVAFIILCARDDHRSRLAAAFVLGLGMGAQPVLIFLTPLLMAPGLQGTSAPGKSPALWRSGTLVLSFLAGASILLFLPIRASQHPVLNWGDPSTLERFWRVITRADYGGLKLHPEQSVFAWSPSGIWLQVHQFFQSFAGELGWGAVLLGFRGAWMLWHEPRFQRWTVGLLFSCALLGPGFFVLSNLPWTEKTTSAILQPYLLLVTALWVPFLIKGIQTNKHWKSAALLLATIALHPKALPSSRNDFLAYDYAQNLMRALPPNAVLFDPDDPTTFTLRALQLTQGKRTDIIPLTFFRTRWGYEHIKRMWPDLLPPVPLDNSQDLQKAFWTYSVTKRPFYAELPQKLGGLPYRSAGLVYKVNLPPTKAEKDWQDQSAGALAMVVRRGHFQTTAYDDFFSRQVLGYYAAAHSNLGLAYAEAGRADKAEHHYLEALRIDPSLMAALNNRGILAYTRRDYAEAIRHYEAALRQDPSNHSLQNNLELVRTAEKNLRQN